MAARMGHDIQTLHLAILHHMLSHPVTFTHSQIHTLISWKQMRRLRNSEVLDPERFQTRLVMEYEGAAIHVSAREYEFCQRASSCIGVGRVSINRLTYQGILTRHTGKAY